MSLRTIPEAYRIYWCDLFSVRSAVQKWWRYIHIHSSFYIYRKNAHLSEMSSLLNSSSDRKTEHHKICVASGNVLRLTTNSLWPVCSSNYKKKKLLWRDFTQYLNRQQSIVFININVHTGNNVISLTMCIFVSVTQLYSKFANCVRWIRFVYIM